ncbi:hypothetical protein F8388_010702 [Cannabis sativa]|uniref:Ubiquinol oxidase n=1 Tax=Cannabis sativa TaxID=3483 RepID=A0A7J6G5J5_CANSA|nr:hypothetical protein F8388_010702 [Cannabis sativa]
MNSHCEVVDHFEGEAVNPNETTINAFKTSKKRQTSVIGEHSDKKMVLVNNLAYDPVVGQCFAKCIAKINLPINIREIVVFEELIQKLIIQCSQSKTTRIDFIKAYKAMCAELIETIWVWSNVMVGGVLLHLRSLRKFEQIGDWIKALLEEANNERMHLMKMELTIDYFV